MGTKRKLTLLAVGFVIALFVCYKLAIAKTVALKAEFNSLKKEAVLFENTPKQLSVLKQKQQYYDSILSTYRLGKTSIQNSLLEVINTISDSTNTKVIAFNEPHEIKQNDLVVKTYGFTLEGQYGDILGLIYNLEQKHRFGEIINLHFEKKKDYRKNKNYLQAHVLLRSFY